MSIGAYLRNRLGRLVGDLLLPTKVIFPNNTEQLTAPTTGCAHMYVTATAPTTFAVAGTYYKLAGTTDAYICEEFSHSNNRLTYLPTITRKFTAIVAFSISTNVKDIVVSFELYKNGAGGDIVASRIKRTLRAVGDIYSMSLSCKVELAQNDFVELWGSADANNVNITLETLGFVITG